MNFEQETLTKVVEARSAAVSAQSAGPANAGAAAAAENMLTGALRQLFALVENYPDLKANQNVLDLQEQLTTTENQIGFSRQHYNSSVREYNTAIQTFPNVVLAGMFGFRARDYFQIEEADGRSRSSTSRPELMSASPAPTTFYREIDRNRRESWVLVAAVIVVLGLLGWGDRRRHRLRLVGRGHRGGGRDGDERRLLLCRRCAGPCARAAPGRSTSRNPPEGYRQLVNVVTEMSLAGGDTDAPRARDRRHRAERLCHRTGPAARLGRGHQRAAREAGSRAAAGGPGARDEPHRQLRHPLHPAGRGAGREHRAPLGLVPALHLLGRSWPRRR